MGETAARPQAEAPYTIGFHLVPGFPMMAFASAIEPLRAANRLAGLPLFERRLYSHDGAPVGLMEDAIEEPRDVRDIAAAIELSPRQLERLFAKYLKQNPSRYYLELRLDRARVLLAQTTQPILDVAVACGFASASHFSRCYRTLYGCKPSDERAPAPVVRRTLNARPI